jgi:hypothetical protein
MLIIIIAAIGTSIIVFLLGRYSRWKLPDFTDVFTESNLQIAVGILVTIVWAVTVTAEILIPAYTVSVLIHGIMGAVVGYLFSEDGITFSLGGEN